MPEPLATRRLDWKTLRTGYLHTLPLGLSAVPFGAIYAVNAHAAGLDAAQTLAMSLIVFAGASQFTAAGLVASHTAPPTIVLTTLIINLRHLLLGASLAPYLRRLPLPTKLLLAFGITDETYAVGIRRFMAGEGSATYQAGSNLCLYTCWQGSTLLGLLAGALIRDPSAYGLDLVFPLTFIALLTPLLRSRIGALVAVTSLVLSLVGALLLPGRWYILIAGVLASGLGAALGASQSAPLSQRRSA